MMWRARCVRMRPALRMRKLFILSILVAALSAAAFPQETGAIKGRVRSSRGDTISNASVTARQNSQDVASAKSNDKGEFKLSGLQPGVYNFVFEARGYSSGIKYNVEIKKGQTKDLGDQLYLTVDRGSRVIIQGSVFYKDGTSVSGATVDFEKITDSGSRRIASSRTSYSGEFGFSQPDTGHAKYRFTVTYKGSTATKELEVENAAVYRVALKLEINREEKAN